MDREVEVHEAQDKWDSLLDRVAQGEEIIITKDGTAIARLISANASNDRVNVEGQGQAPVD
jgi:prevent-host-death family protein